MISRNDIVDFFSSRSGKSFLIFAVSCALLAGAVGYGFYYSSVRWFQSSTGEQKTTAIRLVDAFVATYTGARTDHMTSEAPVPATFRAQGVERYNQGRTSDDSFSLIWVGPQGREIVTPPGDEITAETIRRFSGTSKPIAETAYFKKGDEVLLRTIYPAIANQPSCVDCHNQLRPDRAQWKLNDVMGAFVLSVRADTFLTRAAKEGTAVGLFIFAVATAIGFFFSLSQHRYLIRRTAAERELRAAKIDAEAANISKSQFLATMSHELRTPLNSILGFSEIIMKERAGPLGNGKYRDYAEDIHGSGQHLLAIINDILDMSKIEAGQLILHDDVINIPAMLESCRKYVQQRADDAGVELVTTVAANLPEITADELRLRQIILNLLSNAVKFTPKRGRVTMGAEIDADGPVLWVTDTGLGMTSEEVAIALQPFRQVDNSLQRSHEGTGLGLPLTKNLVELHGGTLTLQSAPGKGTEVRIRFPYERIRPQPQAARRIA
jgi:signal transduction histidine kinase